MTFHNPTPAVASPKKVDTRRIILHFDYDCFYASVFEHENPALRSLPLAVQQKQIIVTCNYEARRRGLKKLQLITEAKKLVPDVIIVLGEELGRFRDASKALYRYLESFSWNGKVERLGFDEVFMDVTDIVSFNRILLNPNDLAHSFFQLKENDPTAGFLFDATNIAGHTFPLSPSQITPQLASTAPVEDGTDELLMRLILGSHLAQHVRLSLEHLQGYTSTVGISTNKLLSKLVGNLNKPKGQTTLIPPYTTAYGRESNVTVFLDGHDVGKIPGIGFKMSQRIRKHVLSRPADFNAGLIYGQTLESVTIRDVRLFPEIGPEALDGILGGPGTEKGIGAKVWGLINGNDNTEVQKAKKLPAQISIEDSYIRLDTSAQVLVELGMLATSLIKRMHKDLLEYDEADDADHAQRWIAHPKTIRLSTRPRLPLNLDGSRTRSFNRMSRSGPLPTFVFNLKDSIDAVVEKLVQETLIPMFRRLHPQPSGWNLSLVNLCVTNMVESASEDGKGGGRDIGRMFRRQEDVLKEWKVEDRDVPPDPPPKIETAESTDEGLAEPSAGAEATETAVTGSEDVATFEESSFDESLQWEEDNEEDANRERCNTCGAVIPGFAMAAHERFHDLES